MNIKELIDYKINLLIDIIMTDGVSPSDLANNIFSDEYTSISFYKDGEFVIGELRFNTKTNREIIRMKYFYNLYMKVQRIEECTNTNCVSVWDRSMREQDLVNEIIELMKVLYTNTQIVDFVKSLPDDIKNKLTDELEKIA